MTSPESEHDQAIERLIDALASTDHETVLAHTGDDERAHAEALALLAYAEPEAVPAPSTRDAILRAVSDTPVADRPAPVATLPQPEPTTTAEVIPLASRRPASTGLTWALAAMLVASLAGLAFFAGQVGAHRQTIEDLQARQAFAPDLAGRLTGLEKELELTRQRLDLASSIARQVYPMRTASDDQRGPRGVMFVCGQHQRWLLSVKGLEPAEAGFEYHLWFDTDEGPIDGGVVQVGINQLAERHAMSMPLKTNGFYLTRERADIGATAPSEERVLVSDRAIDI